MEKLVTTVEELQQRTLEILRGCKGGMDKESLHAAVLLLGEVEDLQAMIKLLQNGEILGSVDEEGEVVLRMPEGADDASAL